MIIVGLTGGIGHGKTTLASLLAGHCHSAYHFESWELIAEVASALLSEQTTHPLADDIDGINNWLIPLADIVNFHMHTSVSFRDIRVSPESLAEKPENYAKLLEYLQAVAADPELPHRIIDIDTKDDFRPLLQWLGGYMMTISPGLWYGEIVRRISQLRANGYELVTVGGVRYPDDAERIRNTGGMILRLQRPLEPTLDTNDLTERERSFIKADATISNNGSLAELSSLAGHIYEDLKLRQLQSEYSSKI